MSEITVTKLA